jgi:hypothetical protein
MSWVQAYVTGTNPAARSRHTTTLITLPVAPSVTSSPPSGRTFANYLLIFGGGDDRRLYNDLYMLNTDTQQWFRVEAKGEPPSPRWGHTATLIDRQVPQNVIHWLT